MNVLVINGGSSTYKFALFNLEQTKTYVEPIWEETIEWVDGHRQKELLKTLHSLFDGSKPLLRNPQELFAIGHRIVHGRDLSAPMIINEKLVDIIRENNLLAPLHNPVNLEGVEAALKLFPQVPQVAVFDTAFHLTMPEKIKTYPAPWQWKERKIIKYGFHGISHEYCAEKAAQILGKNDLRIVNCHLGNGASLCAIRNGKSINTTMGFTPMEGLMMGSRSGSIDPGAIFFLLREKIVHPASLDYQLNFESGLKGISGVSVDMREILKGIRERNSRCLLAYEMYIHSLISYIAAMIASLNGIDALIFTAGIGENSPEVRKDACRELGYLGLKIDDAKNQPHPKNCIISAEDSKAAILVINTREDWAIARTCCRVLHSNR